MKYPTTENIVRAVCSQLNAVADQLYSKDIQAMVPVTPTDVLSEPGKYRVHSDVRTISAIIMRKHVILPFSYDDGRAPTYVDIGTQLKTNKGGGLRIRMVTMCELMRENPVYRSVYVGAVKELIGEGHELHKTERIETSPCP